LPNNQKPKNKQVKIIKLSPSIPAKPLKEVLEKLKFFKIKGNKSLRRLNPTKNCHMLKH